MPHGAFIGGLPAFNTKTGAVVVAKIELFHIAVQVVFPDVVDVPTNPLLSTAKWLSTALVGDAVARE